MKLHVTSINWHPKGSIDLPVLSLAAVQSLQSSKIGMVFSYPGCDFMKFVVLNDQEDLATMHAILGGDWDDWKGSVDDQLLLRALTGYIESHPQQEAFCFVAANS